MQRQTKSDLFVGITSWNSSLFLPVCLESLHKCTKGVDFDVAVFDNSSTDNSAEIARSYGAKVISGALRQGDAINVLIKESKARYTLLIHSDVVLLNPTWFEILSSTIVEPVALVSPEDIGCGPLTRPFGKNQPESSFLFFETSALAKLKKLTIRIDGLIPKFRRYVDFYGPHITHNIPKHLKAGGLDWQPMEVRVSDRVSDPIYTPEFEPAVWDAELSYLRYGLGNFYSLHGQVTHYHNWYDRIAKKVDPESREETSAAGGFPLAYISAYTQAFLKDYAADSLVIPGSQVDEREPRAL